MFCSVSNCDKLARTKGMCSVHYERKKAGWTDEDMLKPIRKYGDKSLCKIENCNRMIHSKGYCNAHYKRKFIFKWPDENLSKPINSQ